MLQPLHSRYLATEALTPPRVQILGLARKEDADVDFLHVRVSSPVGSFACWFGLDPRQDETLMQLVRSCLHDNPGDEALRLFWKYDHGSEGTINHRDPELLTIEIGNAALRTLRRVPCSKGMLNMAATFTRVDFFKNLVPYVVSAKQFWKYVMRLSSHPATAASALECMEQNAETLLQTVSPRELALCVASAFRWDFAVRFWCDAILTRLQPEDRSIITRLAHSRSPRVRSNVNRWTGRKEGTASQDTPPYDSAALLSRIYSLGHRNQEEGASPFEFATPSDELIFRGVLPKFRGTSAFLNRSDAFRCAHYSLVEHWLSKLDSRKPDILQERLQELDTASRKLWSLCRDERSPLSVEEPMGRKLWRAQEKCLLATVRERWGFTAYWHPLIAGPQPEDVLSFWLRRDFEDLTIEADPSLFLRDSDLVHLQEPIRKILVAKGYDRIYYLSSEVEDHGNEFNIRDDIRDFSIELGSERFCCPTEAEWIIYGSHEGTIAFGGKWLVEEIASLLSELGWPEKHLEPLCPEGDILAADWQVDGRNNFHDLFDRSFRKNIVDLFDYPYWLLMVSPARCGVMGTLATEPMPDGWWQYLPSWAQRLDLNRIRDQLVAANPELAPFRHVPCDLVVDRRPNDTARREAEPSILVDVLWLCFTDFITQALFASFPRGYSPPIVREKFSLILHFGSRAELFLNLLRGKKRNLKFSQSVKGEVADQANIQLPGNEDNERMEYDAIGGFGPINWDGDNEIQDFVWLSLLRFLVGHQLAHLHLYATGGNTADAVRERGLVPDNQDLRELIDMADGMENVLPTILEVEADMLAMSWCASCVPDTNKDQLLLMGGIYHLCRGLQELEQRVPSQILWRFRTSAVRSWILDSRYGGERFLHALDDQYQGKTEFYFKMAENFAAS